MAEGELDGSPGDFISNFEQTKTHSDHHGADLHDITSTRAQKGH